MANVGFGVRVKCAGYQCGVGGLSFVDPVLRARVVTQRGSGAMVKLEWRVRSGSMLAALGCLSASRKGLEFSGIIHYAAWLLAPRRLEKKEK